MAEQRRGENTQPGQGEQLPKGAAAQLNAVTPPEGEMAAAAAGAVAPQQAAALPAAPPGPVDWADDDDDGVGNYSPGSEDEEILFDNPPNAMPVRAMTPERRPVPIKVVRHMAMMAAIARDPKAPDSVRALYRSLVDHLEADIRREG